MRTAYIRATGIGSKQSKANETGERCDPRRAVSSRIFHRITASWVRYVCLYLHNMMLGSKASDPMMPSDFCVFHTPEIRKTFEIRSFSCGK